MIKPKTTILLFALGVFLSFSNANAFTVLSAHKYAWSDNVGYINFEHVTVSDSVLSGYAWSENSGFINFSPLQGGVVNDGTGNLSGSAWGEALGWIDFNNVSINGVSGQFSGTAEGSLSGTITFDCPNFCDVQTDWRQTIVPVITPPSGVGGGGGGGGGGGNVGSVASVLFPNAGVTQSFPGPGPVPVNPRNIVSAAPPSPATEKVFLAVESPRGAIDEKGNSSPAPVSLPDAGSPKPAGPTTWFFNNNFLLYLIIIILFIILALALARELTRRREQRDHLHSEE